MGKNGAKGNHVVKLCDIHAEKNVTINSNALYNEYMPIKYYLGREAYESFCRGRVSFLWGCGP